MTDAIGIWAYRMTIVEKTIASLVKYTPADIPIYIMEQTAPEMTAERERLQKAVEPCGDRIKIHKCFMNRHRGNAPLSIIKFLNDHPQIQHLLKIDDDFIVHSDLYTALKEAYDSQPNTLWSQALCPINICNLDILKQRVKECEWLPDEALDTNRMYEWLHSDNALIYKLWESTTPPSRILPQLRSGERFVLEPRCSRSISAGHYFANRKDILLVGGIWDEREWQKLYLSSGRPHVMDTHNIAYHLSWYPTAKFALDTIVPNIIDKTEF